MCAVGIFICVEAITAASPSNLSAYTTKISGFSSLRVFPIERIPEPIALTVESKKPGSHLKLWEPFTNYIIDYISKNSENIIFVLWGNYAKKKKVLIDLTKHYIIESNHPSPLSANRGGFFNTKPFSKINNKLKEYDKNEIIWDYNLDK